MRCLSMEQLSSELRGGNCLVPNRPARMGRVGWTPAPPFDCLQGVTQVNPELNWDFNMAVPQTRPCTAGGGDLGRTASRRLCGAAACGSRHGCSASGAGLLTASRRAFGVPAPTSKEPFALSPCQLKPENGWALGVWAQAVPAGRWQCKGPRCLPAGLLTPEPCSSPTRKPFTSPEVGALFPSYA